MRSKYLDLFVKLFKCLVVCAVLSIPATLITISAVGGTYDEDYLITPIVFAIAFIIIVYVMFYALCADIIEKKGYSKGEIPLLLIAFVTGPFVFFYMLALPSKRESVAVKPSVCESDADTSVKATTSNDKKAVE